MLQSHLGSLTCGVRAARRMGPGEEVATWGQSGAPNTQGCIKTELVTSRATLPSTRHSSADNSRCATYIHVCIHTHTCTYSHAQLSHVCIQPSLQRELSPFGSPRSGKRFTGLLRSAGSGAEFGLDNQSSPTGHNSRAHKLTWLK